MLKANFSLKIMEKPPDVTNLIATLDVTHTNANVFFLSFLGKLHTFCTLKVLVGFDEYVSMHNMLKKSRIT